MGFWAGIKYALNSTLGTAGFKPLDKLIVDNITSNIKVAASDIPIKVLVNSATIPHTSDDTEMATFTAKVSGTVRVKASISGSTTTTKKLWCVRDSTGGTLKTASTKDSDSLSIDFNVVKGGTYTVHMSTTATGLIVDACNGLSVCGNSYLGTLIS